MEAMLDPEKAIERGTYKKIGEKAKQYGTQTKEFVEEGIASLKGKAGRAKEAIFNPQTYKNIGQGVGTLSKGVGLGILGYGGASELAEATGTEGIVNPALTTVGGAQILGELAKKRLGYLAGPGRLLMNPYAAVGLGTAGTYANMMKSNYKELMSLPPEIRKQISDSKDVYQKLEKKRENFSLLYQQYQQIETDLPYVFNAIPQTPQSSLFIGKLN
jgi:hypothetical protein